MLLINTLGNIGIVPNAFYLLLYEYSHEKTPHRSLKLPDEVFSSVLLIHTCHFYYIYILLFCFLFYYICIIKSSDTFLCIALYSFLFYGWELYNLKKDFFRCSTSKRGRFGETVNMAVNTKEQLSNCSSSLLIWLDAPSNNP